jgi:hypothetical protein
MQRHQWDEAENALREAVTIAEAIGNPTQIWKSYLSLGRFHTERKRPELAGQAFKAAREVVDQMKANLQHSGLRASLESAPMIQRVYKLSGR